MSNEEIIEYEGRRFVRTGERRIRVGSGEWYMGENVCLEPIQCTGAWDFTPEGREILRELPAETPAPTAESEQDSAVSALRVLNEETVLAGFPGGDRTQTLANVRAMASLLAEAEEALAKLLRITSPAKWPETVNHAEIVLARIRAAKEVKK